jgi:hypothetical protein
MTTTAETAARSSGFIQRQRKLTGPAFVQGLVFGWLAHPDATYDQLAQAIARAGSAISPQALEQRFTATAVTCLATVLEAASTAVIRTEAAGTSLLTRFSAVWLLDSSTVRLPDVYAATWPGSGEADTAGAKIHVMLDLVGGGMRGPLLEAGRPHDKHSPLQPAPIEPGALRITDLGFYALKRLRQIGEAKAYWLCRAQVQTHLWTADGRRWTLLAFMRAQRGDAVDVDVALGASEQLPARLIAFRLDGQAAARRRRQVRRQAKKKGQTVSADRLALAGWDISVTNVPAALLSADESRILLRARWQIELLFKRWKSAGQIDAWRSQRAERILCELYAKLLGQLITQWCSVVGAWQCLERSLVKVTRVVQDHAIALAYALPTLRRLTALLRQLIAACQTSCRVNTRKTKPTHAQLIQEPARAA